MIGGPIDAIIFDVDGTLAETEEAHRLAFNQAFAEAGLDWTWDQALYRDLLKVTGGKERIAHYLSSLRPPRWGGTGGEAVRMRQAAAVETPGASPFPTVTSRCDVYPSPLLGREESDQADAIRALHARKTEIYTARIDAGAVAFRPGVEGLIQEARRRGVALTIATTTSRPNIDALLGAVLGPDSLGWFKTIASGDRVEARKPAPDVYLLALRGLGVPAGRAIAIEDSWNGVRSARAAGLHVIATPSLYSADEDFSEATVIATPEGVAAALGWV
jgi:beta-phosphoglucomutase-like phosphatase (HAD superfamily)